MHCCLAITGVWRPHWSLLCRFSDSAGASAWLEVRASNVGAVALYEQLHFTERATRRKYYSDGEDAIVMCKELGQTSTSSSNHRP